MKEAVIVSAVRLPVGRVGGALKSIRPEKLGGMVIKEALKRGKVDPEMVDECIFCSCDNEDIKIAARVIALEGGLPIGVPAYQIQRGCGSSLTAVWDAAMMIQTGFAETIVCGGAESTTFAPYLMNKPTRAYSQMPMPWAEPIFSPKEYGNLPNGPTADNIAKRFGLTREDCDAFAVESHRKGAEAYRNHRFDEQILPVEVPLKGGKTMIFDRDEPLREDCTMESLAKLRPSFAPDGVCTAGNSSPLVDGASCVIVMEREKAESLGLDIMARVTNFADAGCEPAIMGEGPVHACRKLFKKTGLTWDDIDLIEMNEAFAAQSVHCIRQLDMPVEKLNVNGGAIALGHPFAATGTILVTKIVYEMRRTDAQRGIVTFCIGGGQGVAMLLEKP
ncbi:MAG: thiolase family protein [Oscillospiraceae bacterium]|nr:thiolase family protein [Oscillospiraceae bacterium]MCD7852860.1 thiolase family protein [Oscillospiraceae bacterium]MCD8128368.1 thiolase family protein [Oscillospiraceae bacterium]MCD8388870.1 thiolase family protein [Oscillospiraceae bacterium]